MERYDYRKAVKDDVVRYIHDNVNYKDFDTLDELGEKLSEDLWIEDSVTGNASGSYTFSTWQAEENLCHNLDLLCEAFKEFGFPTKLDPEFCDVTIRCYLLGSAVQDALTEVEDEFYMAHIGG